MAPIVALWKSAPAVMLVELKTELLVGYVPCDRRKLIRMGRALPARLRETLENLG